LTIYVTGAILLRELLYKKVGDKVIGTKGITYYRDYMIPINYYEDLEKLISTNDSCCYRLVFIEEGMGSLVVNQDKVAILPFTCLCLNENDKIYDVDITGIRMQLLCILPSVINNRLTLEKINSNEGLTTSDMQDRQFLLPFILPDKTYIYFKANYMDTGRRVKEILLTLKELLLVQNDSWPCLTRSYLIELLFLVERTHSFYKEDKKQMNNTVRFSSDDVLLYIHNNYRDKININNLVKLYNTNRTTLSKEFKKATGFSIISYILKTRIEVAAGMLRDTHMNVAVIVERVGFNNITHFNKVFKEYMKCLPNEYRKKYNAG
jgi:AraC family L-rhamnose operon regulatory protein RhaS